MRLWLNKTPNRDFLNRGDTRMVDCTLSENCSKNKLGYKQFISELEFEVIDNKNHFFKKIDIDKQIILINKLIQALDEPQLWFSEHLTQKQHDELMLLQIHDIKSYLDNFYEIAINYFCKDIQEAMNLIYEEYKRDRFIANEIDSQIDEALYYNTLDKMAFGA